MVTDKLEESPAASRAAPIETESAPAGAKACAVPVVPKHTAASRTSRAAGTGPSVRATQWH